MPAFVDTMAYRGDVPWHGLGNTVEGEWIDSSQLLVAAGLDWQAIKVPAYYESSWRQGAEGLVLPKSFEEIPGQFTIARSDTGASLGCTVGKAFEPFQNEELRELGDALCRTGEARWETAGSLHGGRLVWGLAQVAGSIDVRRRDGSTDESVPYCLFYNAHDGSSHLRALLTLVRGVCANTIGFALSQHQRARDKARAAGLDVDGEGADVQARSFSRRHTAGIHDDAQDAADALGIAVEASEVHREVFQQLANTPMPMKAFGTFCAQLLTELEDEKEALERVAEIEKKGGRSATMLDRKGAELAQLFADCAQGNRGEDRFDALNSVTDWIDHQRNRIAVHRKTEERLGIASKSFASGQFGTGADTKRRALQLLTR